MGLRGGKSRQVTAVADRVAELVDAAPELTDAQIERLRGILSGALEKLEASA